MPTSRARLSAPPRFVCLSLPGGQTGHVPVSFIVHLKHVKVYNIVETLSNLTHFFITLKNAINYTTLKTI